MAEMRKTRKIYDQKFAKKWLEDPLLQPWIQPSTEPGSTAFCSYCVRNLKGSKTLMLRHAQNPKHIMRMVKVGSKSDSNSQNVRSLLTTNKRRKGQKAGSPTLPLKWLNDPLLSTWIEPSQNLSYKAYCKLCNLGLNGNLKNMYKHILTPTHQSFCNVPQKEEHESTTFNENSTTYNDEESVIKIKVQLLEVENVLEASKYLNESFKSQKEDNEIGEAEEEEGEEEEERDESVSYVEISTSRISEEPSQSSIADWKNDPSLEQWIDISTEPGTNAYCKWCKCTLSGDQNSMLEHALTSVHEINAKLNKKLKHYDQKFNPDWLEDPLLRSWIAPSNSKTAFCTKCNRHLQGSKTLMYRHAQNPRHTNSVIIAPSDESVKAALRISAFVAEHDLPLDIMDHLPSLFKSIASDSDIMKSTHCSPAKTEFFIKNVLAIDRLNDLSNKLLTTVFSVIVDESSDIYSNKSIALVVRYYDEDTHTVEDSFLTIIDVIDPDNLFKSILDFFTSINVPISNLLGFAADSCNLLLGKYSDVLLKLSQIVPFMYVSGCVVNSLHMCVCKAVSKLPDTYEKLCHDIYDYMYYKPQQVAGFEQVYPLFNVEIQDLVRINNAMWLSMSEVVTKIVENWDTLISYFSICSANEHDTKAQQILLTLTDPMCKLIFLFLNFFLPTVDDLNCEFQGSKYFLNSLLSSIEDKIKMILKFYMKTSYVNETSVADVDSVLECQFLLLENMYFGARVDSFVSSLDPTSYEMVLHFKGHCLNFYMEFCSQILQRVNFRDRVIKYLYILNPEICKSDLYLSIRPLAMLFPNVIAIDMLDQLEAEWWEIKSSTSLKGTEDFFVFWNRVFEERKYPYMTKFIKAMLCLPHSSESIVNTFTAIRRNNIKSRKRHDSAMMSSLLLVREKLRGSSSSNFEISNALLCLANSYVER